MAVPPNPDKAALRGEAPGFCGLSLRGPAKGHSCARVGTPFIMQAYAKGCQLQQHHLTPSKHFSS